MRQCMSQISLKQILKESLVETLQKQRGLLEDVVIEVLEDFALTQAIREGQTTKHSTHADDFRILPGRW